MTKLDAVNYILTGNGQRPVTVLDTSGVSYVAEAERLLDTVELEIQTRGWHFNTLYKVELTPDGSDHVLIPDGVITIDSDDSDSWRDVTQQGDHLYDLDNNTDKFTDTIKVTYVQRLEFTCIPEAFKQWMASEAALRMAESYHPENYARLRVRQADQMTKKAAALRFNGDKSNTNVLNNVDADRFRGRTRNRRGSGGNAFSV